MKNKQYRLSSLKYQLEDKKKRKIRRIVWKLNKEQLAYITDSLHYEVNPYLYGIRTRTLKNYQATKSHLLKDLHHQNKRGKRTVVRSLSSSERKVLDEVGIKYWVEKYEIKL